MSCATKTRPISCTIAVVFLLTLLSSCGGSSSGGGGGDSIVIPDEFLFTMDLDVDGQAPFSLASETYPNRVITMRTIGAPLLGTYAFDTGDYTLGASQINVTYEDWDEPHKTFAIQITSDIVGNIYGEPSAGSLTIFDGVNPIYVEITATGVTLGLDDDPATSYNWSAFYALFENTERELWEIEASLAALILKYAKEEISFVASSLELIETNDDILEDEGQLTFDCDELPITPPLGGGRRIIIANSGDVGPGANFTWLFDYCWDNQNSTKDLLYDGTISMLGLLEVIEEDGTTETITSLGFVPDVTPGGVYYKGFKVYVTEEDDEGNVSISNDRTHIYNGGYSIKFYTE